MPPRRKSLNRPLSTAERMYVAVGPSSAALVRSGLSPLRAQRAEREWERWDAEHGFSWRVGAGYPTMADRLRLEAGDEPDTSAPPPPVALKSRRTLGK